MAAHPLYTCIADEDGSLVVERVLLEAQDLLLG